MDITTRGLERRRELKPASMVGWYDVRQLFKTAGNVLVSTVLGTHADHRVLEPLFDRSKKAPIYDHSVTESGHPRRSIVLDYIADTGDGWNSTYAIFYWATRKILKVGSVETSPGDILVFGGDEVYPVASRDEYDQRLLKPMEAALSKSSEPYPHIYAIPGNHDWYDSLVSFTRLFVSRSWIAGWRSQQSRSYFALKLPGRWWLVATDVGLESDIDDLQLQFLKQVASEIPENDGVILCNAEPFWIKATEYQKNDVNLKLIENLLKDRIRVYIAGDLHHYRRHESPDKRHKITAGGGGAFLHPTHGWSKEPLPGSFKLIEAATFPPEKESRKLTRKNILFFIKNPTFGFVTSILYTLTAWSFMADIGHYSMTAANVWPALCAVIEAGFQKSVAAFWVTLILLAFYLFTGTTSKAYKIIGGFTHALLHLAACFILGWAGGLFAVQMGAVFPHTMYEIYSGAVLLVGGYFAGSMLMGLYLYVSLNVFGRHRNEAFSSLKIEDWKNFLRIHIDSEGALTIFPIGISRVPRRWTRVKDGDGNCLYEPNDPAATPPELIEEPIVVFK